MFSAEISLSAPVTVNASVLAALTLHNAQRAVADSNPDARYLLNVQKWNLIHTIPEGPGKRFVLAVINSHTERMKF